MTAPPSALWLRAGGKPESSLRCELHTPQGPASLQWLRSSTHLVLPFAAGSVSTLVISQALEFLDTPTTLRLLLEAHRVLAAGGQLVIELPDHDAALDGWRSGDEERVRRVGEVPPADVETWPARGVADGLDYRAAALFCAFGCDGPPAYRGPPAVSLPSLRWMRDRWTPFRLATDLRHALLETEPRFQLERKNAWGRRELEQLLQRAGFQARSFEPEAVAEMLAGLPGVKLPREGRLGCKAEPVLPTSRVGASTEERLRDCQQAVARQPQLAERHYCLLWDVFGRALREAAARRGRAEPDATFSRQGYRMGRLPEGPVAALVDSLERATPVLLAMDDYAPGFAFNDALNPEAVAGINRSSLFLDLGDEQRQRLIPLLEALEEPVGACLGTPFRVINVRCWKTPADAAREETNGWHTDELFPPEVLKVMIYLTPAGPQTGTTELALEDGSRVVAEGPPGTYMLFKNFERTHRGVPPRAGARWVLELTVAPWPEDDLRPFHAGLNAEFPLVPWAPVEQP